MKDIKTLTTSVSPELLDLMDEIDVQATVAADPVDTAFQIHDAISSWVSKHIRFMEKSDDLVLSTLLDLTAQGMSGCPQEAQQALDKLRACLPFLKVRSSSLWQMN